MNYANLVQNKRRKMLCLILLLVLYPFINVSAINLTHIVKKHKGVIQPSCIAEDLERYSAVGWIYPIPHSKEDLPNITTRYTPTYDNEFNCQFTKNSLCTARWSIRDWSTDESSSRTRDVIMDSRWEEFPLILVSNETKEFKHDNIEVVDQASFSVRAQGFVEVFLCSGWDPYNYPCHYISFNGTEVYYKQYPVIPKDIKPDSEDKGAEHFKTIKNVLSHEEWRTFNIDWSDKTNVVLTDVISNTVLIKHDLKDNEKFTPLYMFLRSYNASLWKIHHNHFFFTNSAQISRLGPQLTLNNKDLCISMFIKTCITCETVFFYLTQVAQKKVLKRIGPTNNEWIEIKIKEENTQYEKVNLFIETKLINTNSTGTGYWAIDNVRICNENEVKISYLKLGNNTKVDTEDISCQLIEKPSWRPKQLIFDSIEDFPEISSVSDETSITLTWEQEDHNNEINYFVTYKANDICLSEPHNLKRVKSNGFLWTKVNEITIPDLVPYTLYNVTVETVLHQNVRSKMINTLETVEPTYEERPLNIQIRAMDNRVNVTWDKVSCQDRYGRLVYNVVVKNAELNFTKTISLQTDNSYQISGLKPYTEYSLEIITGRNGRSIYSGKNIYSVVYNFTTSAGIAPPVKDLEIYAIDANSAYLRYSLPENPMGVILEVQIMKCNALSYYKCKTFITPLRRCSFWKNKYCNDILHLTPNMQWVFRVSLKNKDTNTFGKESSVKGYTIETVPGKPGNITYRILDCPQLRDYCNLMVNWLHPYDQKGTITEFEIILNSTDKHGTSEEDTFIHEIYKVENKTYYPSYTYQINYLPYSSHYNLYIQSANKMFKSNFTQTHVKIDNVGDHIDQHPKLIGKSDSTLIFRLPHLDRRLDHYNLTVVVQDYNSSVKINDELLKNPKVADHLCHRYGEAWISDFVTVTSNDTGNIMIGDAEKHALKPKTKYCITFIVSNKYKDTEHDVIYYEKLRTGEAPPAPKEASGSYNHLYLLLILLLLIPIGFLVYRHMSKRRLIPKANENPENVYESLPFEECDSNGVSNENYDRLIHK